MQCTSFARACIFSSMPSIASIATGDRKPCRLVDPHVGVSVCHRRDRHCRLHWLRGSCERSRPPSVAAWPHEVAGPLATEIHHVLTTSHGGLVTISAVFAVYFSSSGIESLRIELNRAYGLRERQSFWVLRFESIGFVLLSAIAMLVVAFLVVLGPLLFKAAAAYVPALAPLEFALRFCAFQRQQCCARSRAVHPTHVAAGRTARIWHSVARHPGNDGTVADLQFRIRPLSRRVRLDQLPWPRSRRMDFYLRCRPPEGSPKYNSSPFRSRARKCNSCV